MARGEIGEMASVSVRSASQSGAQIPAKAAHSLIHGVFECLHIALDPKGKGFLRAACGYRGVDRQAPKGQANGHRNNIDYKYMM